MKNWHYRINIEGWLTDNQSFNIECEVGKETENGISFPRVRGNKTMKYANQGSRVSSWSATFSIVHSGSRLYVDVSEWGEFLYHHCIRCVGKESSSLAVNILASDPVNSFVILFSVLPFRAPKVVVSCWVNPSWVRVSLIEVPSVEEKSLKRNSVYWILNWTRSQSRSLAGTKMRIPSSCPLPYVIGCFPTAH